MKIVPYMADYQREVINLILTIQQEEFDVAIGLAEQADLLAIESHYANFWLVISKGEVVGCIGLVDLKNQNAALKKMFVREDYRKAGLGKLLVDRFVEECQKNGISAIYLGTTQHFRAAQRFYKKYGFMEIGKDDLPSNFPLLAVDDTFYRFLI